jgi:starch synthase (maltosyl-transferring)
MADLKRLVRTAREEYGIEVALDVAFQASPDHPWVKEHPEWFRHRPDGTIAYAENPPKKYEDIYPIDFETEDWESLWLELESVFRHWIEKAGIRIFRVDNPHTKSLRFWEWCIGPAEGGPPGRHLPVRGVHAAEGDVPAGEAGLHPELHVLRLASGPLGDRGVLQRAGPPAGGGLLPAQRVAQHAGHPDGPAPVGGEAHVPPAPGAGGHAVGQLRDLRPGVRAHGQPPREAGKEEYLDSEKYQIRDWDLEADNIREYITRINAIRRENPALQHNRSLRFHGSDNQAIIAYSKWSHADGTPYTYRHLEERPGDDGNLILVVVNLDPKHTQSSMIHLPLDQWGIDPNDSFEVHDLMSNARYVWRGWSNYVELNPHAFPAHIFRVRRSGPQGRARAGGILGGAASGRAGGRPSGAGRLAFGSQEGAPVGRKGLASGSQRRPSGAQEGSPWLAGGLAFGSQRRPSTPALVRTGRMGESGGGGADPLPGRHGRGRAHPDSETS